MGDLSNSGAPRASLMHAAEEWASRASRDELKAHAAAIWQAMPDTDRAGFADYIGRSAVAAVFRRPELVDAEGHDEGGAA